MSERIVIIGPGRLGLALGSALVQNGAVERLGYFGRSLEPPPHPLFDGDAAAEYRLAGGPVPGDTTLLLLAVPDHALATVAQEVARLGAAPPGAAALHLAGGVSTDVLAPLAAVGWAIGSMHPLQSVADPWSGSDRLVGASYALAGEPSAVAAARRVVSALGGRAVVVPPKLRPLYHAGATVAANSLVALVGFSVRLLMQSGFSEEEAVSALLPLIRGTLTNLEDLGVPAALTGPVARGDVDTVRLHLGRLSPEDRRVYSALGLETLRLARGAGLDPDRAAELEALLSMG